MKYLPITTIVLWTSIIIGYLYTREFILQPIIKFPAFILLSIFLPVCFWVLVSQNRRVYAFVFIAIFIFDTSILSYLAFSNYSFLNSLAPYKETRIDPQLVELLVTGENQETRSVVAQIIFGKHGISLPFKTDDDHFVLYSPTKANKYTFQKNNAENSRLSFLKYNTTYQIDSLLFLIAMHVSIFMVLLSFLILYEKPARGIL